MLVWGCISARDMGNLHILRGIMISEGFIYYYVFGATYAAITSSLF